MCQFLGADALENIDSLGGKVEIGRPESFGQWLEGPVRRFECLGGALAETEVACDFGVVTKVETDFGKSCED